MLPRLVRQAWISAVRTIFPLSLVSPRPTKIPASLPLLSQDDWIASLETGIFVETTSSLPNVKV